MNRKQSTVVSLMIVVSLFMIGNITVVRGVIPIEQLSLFRQFMWFVTSNILIFIFLGIMIGGIIIYTLRDKHK